jgi:hypothetical protein
MQGNDNDAASVCSARRQIGGQESGVGNDFLWHFPVIGGRIVDGGTVHLKNCPSTQRKQHYVEAGDSEPAPPSTALHGKALFIAIGGTKWLSILSGWSCNT